MRVQLTRASVLSLFFPDPRALEYEEIFSFHPAFPHDIGRKATIHEEIPDRMEPGKRREEKEYPPVRCQNPFHLFRKSPDHTGSILPPVQRILEPVVHSLFGESGEIGGIEDDKVKWAAYATQEIGTHDINTKTLGEADCVGIDIACNNGYLS